MRTRVRGQLFRGARGLEASGFPPEVRNFAIKPSRRLGFAGLLSAALVACAWLFAAGAAPTANAQGGCANEDIRNQQGAEQLPDCRAYEQVSPLEKNNNHIGIEYLAGDNTLSPILSDPDGDGVLYGSFGSFAGAPSQNLGNAYAGRRTGNGWNTTPLTAPVYPFGGFVLGKVYGTTPDLSKQLVDSGHALAPGGVEGDRNAYVHDTTDDSYELVSTWDSLGTTSFGTWDVTGVSSDGERWFIDDFIHLDGVNHLTPTTGPPVTCTTSSCSNIFEYSDGEIKVVSLLPDGTALNGLARTGSSVAGATGQVARRAVSEDGSHVYWHEQEAIGSDQEALYLNHNGQGTLVTERETDNSEQLGAFWFATRDGSQAFLTSDDQLTADASPSGLDLYRYDADSDDLVDLTPTGTSAAVTRVLGTSEDGSHVYFMATGDLAPGATAGQHNIYAWHNGDIRLIATSASDLSEDSLGSMRLSRVSPNGQHFGFIAGGPLTGPNPQPDVGAEQAYLYDYEDDTLVCASCPPGGTSATGDVLFETREPTVSVGVRIVPNLRQGTSRNVLDDGRVFFTSPDALVPQDANGKLDVYQYSDGEAHLISSGQSAQSSLFGDASPDGTDVYFLTLSQLVGQDTDTLGDLYSARVNGGLASQNPIPEPECQDDECQGEPSGSPDDEDLGTGGSGAGNPDIEASCDPQQANLDRYSDRIKKLKSKKKQAQKKARSSSRKKAKKARKKAKRIGRKIKKTRSKKRDAKRDLRSCREAK